MVNGEWSIGNCQYAMCKMAKLQTGNVVTGANQLIL